MYFAVRTTALGLTLAWLLGEARAGDPAETLRESLDNVRRAIDGLHPLPTLPALAPMSSPYQTYTIRFIGAVISAGTAAGEEWDGPGTFDASAVQALLGTLGMAVGTNGFADMSSSGAIAGVTRQFTKGIAAPDVVGSVHFHGTTTRALAAVAGTPLALAHRGSYTPDSYLPRFNVAYESWPVYPDSGFTIALWDLDDTNPDVIGTAVISATEIEAAAGSGKVVTLPVAEQTNGQLLGIQVIVQKVAVPGAPPRLHGSRWQ